MQNVSKAHDVQKDKILRFSVVEYNRFTKINGDQAKLEMSRTATSSRGGKAYDEERILMKHRSISPTPTPSWGQKTELVMDSDTVYAPPLVVMEVVDEVMTSKKSCCNQTISPLLYKRHVRIMYRIRLICNFESLCLCSSISHHSVDFAQCTRKASSVATIVSYQVHV